MKKDILNIKLVEIPIISGSQGNKKPNKCHLSNRGKSVGIVHTIGLGISFSNKADFQSSNGSIEINLHCKHPTTTNGFFPVGKQTKSRVPLSVKTFISSIIALRQPG